MPTAERPPTPPPARNLPPSMLRIPGFDMDDPSEYKSVRKQDEPIMLSDVQRLTLNPGDIIVLRCDQSVSPTQSEALRSRIRDLLGDYQVIVLAGGADLGVITRS